jgi:membrane-anchored glycerophosphoryl diester phosphodiesterase (GDPDase)
VLALAATILPIAIVGALYAVASKENMPRDSGATLLILLAIVTVVALILISVRLTFASLAFVADGHRGREALRRSWRLSTGHFWKIFGVVLLGLFLGGVITFAITTVTSSIAPGRDFAAATLTTVGALAVQVIVAPFVTLLTVALYFAIRATGEPLDSAGVLSDVRGRDPA